MKNIVCSLLLIVLFLFPQNSDWYYSNTMSKSIEIAKKLGIVQGYADGSFGEDDFLNRAQAMKILMEISGYPVGDSFDNCFVDVFSNNWFFNYICTAKKNKIVQGYADNFFRPYQIVSEAEFLKLLTSFLELDSYSKRDNEEWFNPYRQFFINKNIKVTTYLEEAITRGKAVDLLIKAKIFKDYQWDEFSLNDFLDFYTKIVNQSILLEDLEGGKKIFVDCPEEEQKEEKDIGENKSSFIETNEKLQVKIEISRGSFTEPDLGENDWKLYTDDFAEEHLITLKNWTSSFWQKDSAFVLKTNYSNFDFELPLTLSKTVASGQEAIFNYDAQKLREVYGLMNVLQFSYLEIDGRDLKLETTINFYTPLPRYKFEILETSKLKKENQGEYSVLIKNKSTHQEIFRKGYWCNGNGEVGCEKDPYQRLYFEKDILPEKTWKVSFRLRDLDTSQNIFYPIYKLKDNLQLGAEEINEQYVISFYRQIDLVVEREKVLKRINQLRANYNLTAVSLNQKLNLVAQNHAYYGVFNYSQISQEDMSPHFEETRLPYFTGKEIYNRAQAVDYFMGERANYSIAEDIAFLTQSSEKIVDEWLRTVYHRYPLLDPLLKEIGFGYVNNNIGQAYNVLLFTFDYYDESLAKEYLLATGLPFIIYPMPEQNTVESSWANNEIPVPFINQKETGPVITIQPVYAGWQTDKNLSPYQITNIFLRDSAGQEIKYLIDANNSQLKKTEEKIVQIGIVAKNKLNSKECYSLEVQYLYNGESKVYRQYFQVQ